MSPLSGFNKPLYFLMTLLCQEKAEKNGKLLGKIIVIPPCFV